MSGYDEGGALLKAIPSQIVLGTQPQNDVGFISTDGSRADVD
jgi:hypothetical protein